MSQKETKLINQDKAKAEATIPAIPSLDDHEALVVAQEQGKEVEILDVHGKPNGIKIRVVGPDSEHFKKVQYALADESLQQQKLGQPSTEEVQKRWFRILAGVTVGWNKFILNGAEYPFSTENALKLYERYPVIREQIAAVTDRSAFIKS